MCIRDSYQPAEPLGYEASKAWAKDQNGRILERKELEDWIKNDRKGEPLDFDEMWVPVTSVMSPTQVDWMQVGRLFTKNGKLKKYTYWREKHGTEAN